MSISLLLLFIGVVLGASYDGKTFQTASSSCLKILRDYPSSENGFYYITNYESTSPYRTYCDMVTNGGGWTLWYANANYADVPYKLPYTSWIDYDIPFVTETMSDISSHDFIGMNPASNLNAVSIMAKQSSWTSGQYSTLHFPSTSSFNDFINMKTVTQSCSSFSNDASVIVDNSASSSYTISKFNAKNNVYGWKSCNADVTIENENTSIEASTDLFLGRLTKDSTDANNYINGCGGALGDNTHCYYYIREQVNPIKPTISSSHSSYTGSFDVTIDFGSNIQFTTPFAVENIVVSDTAVLSNLRNMNNGKYIINVNPMGLTHVTLYVKGDLEYGNKLKTIASASSSWTINAGLNMVTITSNIPENTIVRSEAVTVTFTFTKPVQSLTSADITKDTYTIFSNFASAAGSTYQYVWTASLTVIKPEQSCFRIASDIVISTDMALNQESNTLCITQGYNTVFTVPLTSYYPESASYFKYIPIYLTMSDNYRVDVSKITLSGTASIVSAIHYNRLSSSYIILIDRKEEALTVTFNNGFLLGTDGYVLTVSSTFPTTYTFTVESNEILNLNYQNNIGATGKLLGHGNYIADSKNNANDAIQLVMGGIQYTSTNTQPLSLAQSYYDKEGSLMSLSLWFRLDVDGEKTVLFKDGKGINNSNYYIRINSEHEIMVINGPESDTCAYMNTGITTTQGVWTYIAVRYTIDGIGDGLKDVFINGQLVQSCKFYDNNLPTDGGYLTLGENGGVTIGDFKLSRRLFTDAEITSYYNLYALPTISITSSDDSYTMKYSSAITSFDNTKCTITGDAYSFTIGAYDSEAMSNPLLINWIPTDTASIQTATFTCLVGFGKNSLNEETNYFTKTLYKTISTPSATLTSLYNDINTMSTQSITVTYNHQVLTYYTISVENGSVDTNNNHLLNQNIIINTPNTGIVTVTFTKAKDILGNAFPDMTKTFTIQDSTSLVINRYEPAMNAINVNLATITQLTLEFSQAITLNTEGTFNFIVEETSYPVDVTTIVASEKYVTIPFTALNEFANSGKIVTISTSNSLFTSYADITANTYQFTISSSPLALYADITPAAGLVTDANLVITLDYNQDIVYYDGDITVTSQDETIGYSLTLTPDNKVVFVYSRRVVINIPGGLPMGSQYTVTIPASTFLSASTSQPYPNDIVLTYSTNTPVVPTCTWTPSVTGTDISTPQLIYAITCNKQMKLFNEQDITITNGQGIFAGSLHENNYKLIVIPTFTDLSTPVTITVSGIEGYAKDYDATQQSVAAFTISQAISPILRHYKMENNSIDSSSHGPACYLNNIPFVYGPTNQPNTAYAFTSDTLSWYCPSTSDDIINRYTNTGITFAFWYKVNDNYKNILLFGKYTDTHIYYSFSIINNKLTISTTSSYIEVDAPQVYAWHHIMVSISNIENEGIVNLYIDGVKQIIDTTIVLENYSTSCPLYIGSKNEMSFSDLSIYSMALSEEQLASIYNTASIPVVTISSTETTIVSGNNVSINIHLNKQVTGLTCSSLSLNPSNTITWEPIVTESTNNYVCTGKVTLVGGRISLYVIQNAVVDSNNAGNIESNTISFTINAAEKLFAPFAYTSASIPITSHYFTFTVDFSYNSVSFETSDFSAENGWLESVSKNNRLFTATFALNYNEDVNSKGIIKFNKNVCGTNMDSECKFEFEFAKSFDYVYMNKQAGDKYNDRYWQQHRFSFTSTDSWKIYFDTRCSGDAIVAVRPYPVSSEDSYNTFVFGGGGNSVVSARLTSDSTPSVQQQSTNASPCVSGQWVTLWMQKVGTTVSCGKGDTTYTSLTNSYNDWSGNALIVLSNWNNIVEYGPVHVYLSDSTVDSLPFTSKLVLDNYSTPSQATLSFSTDISNEVTEDKLLIENYVVSGVTKQSDKIYHISLTKAAIDKTEEKQIVKYTIGLKPDTISQLGSTTTAPSTSITSYTVTSIAITASITWDPITGPKTIPIPVTISFNRNYSPDLSSISLPNGGSIVELSKTPNGVIIGVVPNAAGNATVSIPQGLLVDGEEKSNAASLAVYNNQPTNIIFNEGGNDYVYWPSSWRGLENGETGLSFTGSSTGGIRIGFSSIPSKVSGMIEVNLGLENGLLSNIREYLDPIRGYKTLKTYQHNILFVGSQPRSYWVTISGSTISIGSGNTVSVDSKVFDYDIGYQLNSLYFSFASISSGITVSDIVRIPYDTNMGNFKPLTITSSFSGTYTHTLPVVLNVNVDESRIVPLNKWIVNNGYITYGTKDNEFYLYPYGDKSTTFAYLPSRIFDEPNYISMSSDIIRIEMAEYVDTFVLPPRIDNVLCPYWNNIFTVDSKNSIAFDLNLEVTEGTAAYLNLVFAESSLTYTEKRYEINVCGTPSIKYINGVNTLTLATGPISVCVPGQNYKYNIKVDSNGIGLYDKSMNPIVYSTNSTLINIKQYTFSSNPNVLNNKLTSVIKLTNLGVNPPDINVYFSDGFETVKPEWAWDNAGVSTSYDVSYSYETIDNDGIFTITTNSNNQPPWSGSSHTTTPYYGITLPSNWYTITVRAKFAEGSIGGQLCLGLGLTSDLSYGAHGLCIEDWNDSLGGNKNVGWQRPYGSNSGTSWYTFNGDIYSWIDLRITKQSTGNYLLHYRQVDNNINTWSEAGTLTVSQDSNLAFIDRAVLYVFNKNANPKTMHFTDFTVTTYEQDENVLGCYPKIAYGTDDSYFTSSTNTQEECQSRCQDNYKFFAVYQGNKCLCIPDYSFINTVRVAYSTNCNTVCSGDSTNYCGGENHMAIYSIGGKFTYSTSFTEASGWKADIPDSSKGGYSYANNQLYLSTYGSTDINANTRNNAPVMWLSAPAVFSFTVLVDLHNFNGQHVAGVGLYDDLGSNLKGMCGLDWWGTANPLFIWKMYGKNNNYKSVAFDTSKKTWLRYTRDSNGITHCYYKQEDATNWSADHNDDTITSVSGLRIGLFAKSGDTPKTNIYSNFVLTTDITAPTVTFVSTVPSMTATATHSITMQFSKAVTLSGLYELTNCEILSVITQTSSLYVANIRVLQDGEFTFALNSNSAEDLAGNSLTPSETIRSVYSGSDVSVILSTAETSITNSRFTVTVTFSVGVTGFDNSDFIVNNCNIISVNPTSEKTFTVSLEAISVGSISIYIPYGAAVSSSDSSILTSESNILVLNYDYTPVEVVLTSQQKYAKEFPIYVTAAFSKSVDESSFDYSKIELDHGVVKNIKKVNDKVYVLEINQQ
ncbi:hypothetical protein WA158_005119 [Blastocystis sp. Blastoise]